MINPEQPPNFKDIPESPEVKPEIPEEEKEWEEWRSQVDRDFEKIFNIKKEDLKSIPGFYDELSYGQQVLVLNNFKELTLKAIQDKAIEQVKEETAKAGFGGKLWHGIFRQYYLAKAEKLNADAILKGGIEIHHEALTELTREMKESGLDFDYDEKEKRLKTFYAGRFENLGPEEQKIVAKFNEAADKFAKASSGWRYSKKEKAKFAKLENEYKKSLGEVGNIVKKNESSKTDNERLAELNTFKYLADVDKRVRFIQFHSSNPGANGELERIKSRAVWQKALRNTLLERGGYMAMGYVVRTATASLLGLVAAPLAAAGIGGWIARNRAVATLKEEAKLAESGKLIKIREIETAKKIEKLEKQKAKEKDPKKIEQYEKKIEEIKKERPELIASVKAENLEKKIDSLLEKLETTEAIADRIEIINELDTRLNYTRYKMENGLVQYGEGAEKIRHQYALLQKLSEAEVMTRFYGGGKEGKIKVGSETAEKIEKRLNEWLQFKERKVEKNVRGQVIRGALMGAGFAVFGYGIRDYFMGGQVREQIQEEIKGLAEKGTAYITERVGGVGEKISEFGTQAWQYFEWTQPEIAYFIKDIIGRDITPSESLEMLTAQGVTLDSLSKGAGQLDTVRALLKAGATPDSIVAVGAKADTVQQALAEAAPDTVRTLLKGGATPDSLIAAGAKVDTVNQVMAELHPELQSVVSPEQMEMVTIKKGEGVWHAVYRQLEGQLKENPGKFNLKPEDLNDAAKVKATLNKETMRLLVENKIIKPDGTEIRIRDVGTKVILKPDNTIEITEGRTYEWKPPKGMTAEELVERTAHPEKLPVKGPQEVIQEIQATPKTAEGGVGPKEEYYSGATAKVERGELTDIKETEGLELEGGKVKFRYDATGNPIGMSSSLELKGITGSEYFGEDFRKLPQPVVDKLILSGRQINGYIKFYEQLKSGGYAKEANFILNVIKKILGEIDKTYGKGIVNYEKLPDYLKK